MNSVTLVSNKGTYYLLELYKIINNNNSNVDSGCIPLEGINFIEKDVYSGNPRIFKIYFKICENKIH